MQVGGAKTSGWREGRRPGVATLTVELIQKLVCCRVDANVARRWCGEREEREERPQHEANWCGHRPRPNSRRALVSQFSDSWKAVGGGMRVDLIENAPET